eukprot:Tamp_16911.p1 GENE.Tamp_16911~~Tamp_16911.p1  ORF type:complete len:281 (-),score=39.03 Tamp_16911:235-1077(-)
MRVLAGRRGLSDGGSAPAGCALGTSGAAAADSERVMEGEMLREQGSPHDINPPRLPSPIEGLDASGNVLFHGARARGDFLGDTEFAYWPSPCSPAHRQPEDVGFGSPFDQPLAASVWQALSSGRRNNHRHQWLRRDREKDDSYWTALYPSLDNSHSADPSVDSSGDGGGDDEFEISEYDRHAEEFDMLLAGVWEENYNSTNNWRECAGLSRINDREFYDGQNPSSDAFLSGADTPQYSMSGGSDVGSIGGSLGWGVGFCQSSIGGSRVTTPGFMSPLPRD